MTYAKLYVLSSGWNGTDHNGPKKPIEMLGSDSIVYLDGRKHFNNLVADVHNKIAKSIKKDQIVGFQIIKANSLRDAGCNKGAYQVIR